MKSEAIETSSEKSQQLLKDAKKLEQFAARLQLPKSLREQAIEYLLPSKEKGHEIDDIEFTPNTLLTEN